MAKLVDFELYSVVEAARLLGISSAKASRWLDGYQRGGISYPPVVRREPTGSDVVTWGEFVELGYLTEYRDKKVPLQQLRPVINRLREKFRTPYPLAHHKPFIGPGRKLVMQLEREAGVDQRLYMVVDSDQLILSAPAEAFLEKVEFEADIARLWRPTGRRSQVVIDPEMSFGIPTIRGIRTEAITELYQAGEPPALLPERGNSTRTTSTTPSGTSWACDGLRRAPSSWRGCLTGTSLTRTCSVSAMP